MAIKKTPAGANLEQADLFSGVGESYPINRWS